MSNISIKLNLRQLESAVIKMKGKSGEMDCLVIPIEKNNLVQGKKGVYIDLTAIELNEPRESKNGEVPDTHLVKQNLPKEVYATLTDEQKKAMPILGNAIDWSKVSREPAPNNTNVGEPINEDDLPF